MTEPELELELEPELGLESDHPRARAFMISRVCGERIMTDTMCAAARASGVLLLYRTCSSVRRETYTMHADAARAAHTDEVRAVLVQLLMEAQSDAYSVHDEEGTGLTTIVVKSHDAVGACSHSHSRECATQPTFADLDELYALIGVDRVVRTRYALPLYAQEAIRNEWRKAGGPFHTSPSPRTRARTPPPPCECTL
jgi:hypothetical protein